MRGGGRAAVWEYKLEMARLRRPRHSGANNNMSINENNYLYKWLKILLKALIFSFYTYVYDVWWLEASWEQNGSAPRRITQFDHKRPKFATFCVLPSSETVPLGIIDNLTVRNTDSERPPPPSPAVRLPTPLELIFNRYPLHIHRDPQSPASSVISCIDFRVLAIFAVFLKPRVAK